MLASALLMVRDARAAEAKITTGALLGESLRQEAKLSIDRSLAWLKTQQKTNGGWSLDEHPALTALVLSAFLNEPGQRYVAKRPEFIEHGLQHLVKHAQTNGGIYVETLQNYNTSLSVMALVAARDAQFEPLIRRARQFIAGQQNDFGEQGKLDAPTDGGIGYGGSTPHADLSNTLTALEALRASGRADAPELRGLNWDAALQFITRCQQLPSHNQEAWVSDEAANVGGFVYSPGESRAGRTTNAAGRVALRSYGSMTYAGLLSYIYADLKRDDPRVVAAYGWLRRNFTLEENPGLGPSGQFYYFHTMAKALSAYGVESLYLKNGAMVNWRSQLIEKLIELQGRDGAWANEQSARWMEKDPVLATSYAVLALTHALKPQP
jgi:squalene-hopene/tetraprenyl-beta-curcumene cyclase